MHIRKYIFKIFRYCKLFFQNQNKEPLIYDDPNKYAPQLYIEKMNDYIRINGYQKFDVYKDKIIPCSESYDLEKKYKLLKDEFRKNMQNKIVLDLGANSGFFTFLAYQNGAKCIAIDMDLKYTNIIKEVKDYYNYEGISIFQKNISNWNKKSDIVIALSLIHWIYSCTSIYGSMKKLVNYFKSITKEVLYIEWIDPNDNAIKYFKHLDYNINFSDESYNHKKFIMELNKNFSKVIQIGITRKETRILYKAII